MSALLAASAGGAPIEGSGSSAEVGGVSSAPMGSNRGAMDAAAEDNSADQKDRWRKVFLNLRKNLKPRVLAVTYTLIIGITSIRQLVVMKNRLWCSVGSLSRV